MKNTIPLLFIALSMTLVGQPRKMILDADTGNEVDDLYAIVRALIEPSWEITALNATQWQASQWAMEETMEESHRLNQMLVAYLKMEDKVPTLRGGYRRMYDWGDKAQHSAASYEIIRQAMECPEGEKVSVIVLGALTNVASALWIEPEIASRLKVYWLGTNHDFTSGKSPMTDFNSLMDPQATVIMLSSEVEMHIIPHSVSVAMRVDFQETEEKFRGVHPLTDFLLSRWEDHMDAGRYHRTLWDLGLIGAMIHPEWTQVMKVDSYDNPHVWIYHSINSEAIIKEFYESVLNYLNSINN
jgi:inosine-uridine nucleoside N-ribohydrolase